MTLPSLSPVEKKLLLCLLSYYRDFGPGANPAVSALDEEAGLSRHELEEAMRSLWEMGLIEYWALKPAVRLNASGLSLAMAIEGDGKG